MGRGGETLTRKTVLIPVTRSESSRAILPHLEALCSGAETQIILLYVTQPPRTLGIAAPDPDSGYAMEPGGEPIGPRSHPVYAHQQENGLQASAEAELLPTMQQLSAQNYDVSLEVCFTDEPVKEIVRLTKKHAVDLIAMSTRAREGVRRFFFSDIADRVMQQVDVPLLLYHPKA
jgi:nucleotide-binding universal stress UspA family protein